MDLPGLSSASSIHFNVGSFNTMVATSGRCRLFCTVTSNTSRMKSVATSAPSIFTKNCVMSVLVSGTGNHQNHPGTQISHVREPIGVGNRTPLRGIVVFAVRNPGERIPFANHPDAVAADAARRGALFREICAVLGF